jgi:hypothetical protein
MTPVLAAQVRIIRAAADLVEQSGIEDLAVCPGPDEIVIQVPGCCGSAAERAARVAALAALAGCEPAPEHRPGATRGWITARGLFAGHPVRVYTPVEETAP